MAGSIGFIGAGRIGGTLAKVAIARNYQVVLSNSRGPATLADLVATLGPKAKAGTVDEAAKCDLVVVCIPLNAYKAVPADKLNGKIVIDTNNYYPGRDGKMAELEDGSTTSSELLQKHLPNSKVVKAFNNALYSDFENGTPKGTPGRRALPIAGDDASAKKVVANLLDTFGFDVVDLGPLKEGKWVQPISMPSILFGFVFPNSFQKAVLGHIPVYGVRLSEPEFRAALISNGWKPPQDE